VDEGCFCHDTRGTGHPTQLACRTEGGAQRFPSTSNLWEKKTREKENTKIGVKGGGGEINRHGDTGGRSNRVLKGNRGLMSGLKNP